jgi:oligoendopeptidase F
MQPVLTQKWELESLFKGGSSSEKLEQELKYIKDVLRQIESKMDSFQITILEIQGAAKRLHEIESFIHCLCAQDENDGKALEKSAQISVLNATLISLVAKFEEKLLGLTAEEFDELIQKSSLKELTFILREHLSLAKEKLPSHQEELINDLSIDGYHAWSKLYSIVVSKMRISTGANKYLSVGQAENELSSPNREIRENVFKHWENGWMQNEEIFAHILNHLGGFRLKIYENRKYKDVLHEPLIFNRMQEKTLETMWRVVEQSKDLFITYLERKARLLGLEKLAWCDIEAPLGSSVNKVSFDQAAEIIIEYFSSFSSKMASFAKSAFELGWIEAEDRIGKRPGGFCTHFPVSGQSRIFMTFGGTMGNVATLAHELGHAYHNHMVQELPYLNQQYKMSIAETASTFAEMIVVDAAVKNASNDEEKLGLIDDKLSRVIAFLMNIHCRFLFEKEFYNLRKTRVLSAKEMNDMMLESQKLAYKNSLGEWHPHFWAAKMHFYFTDVPFYNFPYTFGYLFSLGLYALFLKEGSSFAKKYDALLEESGQMTVENLAQKFLNTDITKEDFWQNAINILKLDVQTFLTLTSS